MTETQLQQLIGAIHASPQMLVFEFAGAGSQALFWLHGVPGSSRTILEATDRYAAASMADLLGRPPDQFVSQAAAAAMATAAYRRARRLAPAGVDCLGLACTAALVTDRERRGEDRCWVAVRDEAGVSTYTLVMTKGLRDRPGQEALVSQLIISAIAAACGIALPAPLDLRGDEQVATARTPLDDPIARLLDGRVRTVSVAPDGALAADQPISGAILSASFNPLHAGHERLAQAAGAFLNMPVTFELPVQNADKPPLSYAEIEHRLAQFRWRFSAVLSREALFAGKADLYPGCVFVIGYDTAVRLLDLRYYGGADGRDAALAHIRAQGCRFLVAGRLDAGAFHTLRDLDLPASADGMLIALPESAFRVDISSTAIRAQIEQAGQAP